MIIKVMTYNLHKGKNLLGRAYDMERLKVILTEQSYDIGLFQEILGTDRLEKKVIPQIDLLKDETWREHSFSINSYVKNLEHGNSIISKHKIIEEVKIDLTLNRLEKRSALLSLVDIEGIKVQCICTHLNLLKSDRLKQAKILVKFIKNHEIKGIPIILGGDLNDKDGEVSDFLVKKVGFVTPKAEIVNPTFPSFLPVLRLDKILFKGLEYITSEAGKVEKFKTYSDRLPLFYELELSSQ